MAVPAEDWQPPSGYLLKKYAELESKVETLTRQNASLMAALNERVESVEEKLQSMDVLSPASSTVLIEGEPYGKIMKPDPGASVEQANSKKRKRKRKKKHNKKQPK